MEIPATVDLRMNLFAAGVITELESGITNGVLEKENGRPYVIQRPSIDVFQDASAESAGARGRAIYFWEQTDDLYIFNADTIYRGDYSGSISTAPTTGTKKCKILETEDLLVLFDQENDEAWTIDDADTVTQITDVDFPPEQTPAVPLAQGAAYLDGYTFVLGENGTIYNSDLDDPSAWDPLAFITAEREPDKGVYIGKHHDHIVALGTGTIEFFYDAAITNGSPLARRNDIQHNVGCVSGDSVYEHGDIMTFIGSDSAGAIGIYQLKNFQITKVSNSNVDSFVTQAVVKDGILVEASGFTAQGHSYYLLTLYNVVTDQEPIITLCYDVTTGIWGPWDTAIAGLNNFPVLDWTRRTATESQFGQGIMTNGDIISVNDNNVPLDTLNGDGYVLNGFVVTGYVALVGGSGMNINIKIRFGEFDGDTNNWKYCPMIKPMHNQTVNTNSLFLSWSNENSASFNTPRTLDTSLNSRAFRCGRFRRRNHQIDYSGDEQLRMESLEATLKLGDN